MNTDIGSNRFAIKTLGCKVNQYESQLMRENLVKGGFRECLAEDIADIYIINTCTVTGKADSESRHLIGHYHRMNPNAAIVVTGCYAEKDARDVTFLPGVKYIVKNDDKHRIASILGNPDAAAREIAAGAWPSISDFKGHTKAFVKVQDGCNNGCSYCKVPIVRGRSRSKPAGTVVEEVRTLVGGGFKEVILTGICLGAWGHEFGTQGCLLDLLKALDAIEGDFRIRVSSIEPGHVTDDLVGYVASHPRVCRHLHIPLQAGDDGILRRMLRPYTRQDFSGLIKKIRSRAPDIAITTDVIVGFPGETHAQFRNTLDLVREILPSRTHIFPFSKREGTVAARYRDEVDPGEVKKRFTMMKVLTLEASYLYRRRFLDRRLDVLVESKREKRSGMLEGYSGNYIKVLFAGPSHLMRTIVPVKIEDMTLERTIGVMLERSAGGA